MFGNIIGSVLGTVAGGLIDRQNDKKNASRNEDFQREVAQNSLQWAVKDSEAAGINPVLGVTKNFPTVSAPAYSTSNFAGIGADIGRAFDAGRSQEARVQSKLGALAIERAELENEKLRSDIARNNPYSTPSFPSVVTATGDLAGQGNVNIVPTQLNDTEKGKPYKEAGAVSDMTWIRTATGGVAIAPSSDVKQRIEDIAPAEWGWGLRNNLAPIGSSYPKPPKEWLPKGAVDWKFNPFVQEFQPAFPGSRGKVRPYSTFKPFN